MYYRSVKLTGIIGSVYVEQIDIDRFPFQKIKEVFENLEDEDCFISEDLSPRALHKVFELFDLTENLSLDEFTSRTYKESCIVINSKGPVRDRFIREYYRMDSRLQQEVSKIVKSIFL